MRQILYWRWDPIGISNAFPNTWDEYDAYMGKVVALAKRGAPAQEIAAYLESVEMESIELPTDEATRSDVAERVLYWYDESLRRWGERLS